MLDFAEISNPLVTIGLCFVGYKYIVS